MSDARMRRAFALGRCGCRWVAVCALVAVSLATTAQSRCSGLRPDEAALGQAYTQKNWAEVVRSAGGMQARSSDAAFDDGMALAHLGRLPEARAALLAGARACPVQKRFPIELAGVAFERKRYPEAAAWLRRGLKLDPHDAYANDFAGTVYFLMGNTPAALEFWNRVGKPRIASLEFDPHLRVRRLLLDRSFTFSPQAVLREPQWTATEARLTGLDIFSTSNLLLNARPDGTFDAGFHALERDGFGVTPLAAVVSTFSGLPYETVYPSYANIGRSAMNVDSLLRWDAQKRRVWVGLSAPLRDLPQNRWSFAADGREETWAIRPSFSGTAPVLGSLHLQRESATASVTSFTSGRLQWATGAEFSHRAATHVVEGSALTPSLTQAGTALGFLLSAQGKPVDLPVHRFTLTTAAQSETARWWSSPPHLFQKLQGSAQADWFPEAQSNRWEVTQRVRGGGLLGTAPFDELFLLGVERDNDLWLRGHVGTRDGRKGSSPLGTRYLLTNSDLYRRIWSNGLIGIEAGPLFDIGRMGAPTVGLSPQHWLFDTGVAAKVTVLGTSVVLTWGHDLRTGNNAFYGTAQQP